MSKFDPEKPLVTEYRWPVPSASNSTHVVVSQLGGKWYAAFEDMDRNGVWHHRNGSSIAHDNKSKAITGAGEMFLAETEKQARVIQTKDKYARMTEAAQS